MNAHKLNTKMVSTEPVKRQKSNKCHSQVEHQTSKGLLHHHHRSLLSVMLFLLFLASCTAGVNAQRRGEPQTYPLLSAIPETKFRCFGRAAGYYADVETGCQVYHMCDTLEKQFSYLCPNYTLFNQKFMICDHWYMVNCTMSDTFFDLNDHIGEVPTKGFNAIDGRNNQGTRKSTILAQKPSRLQTFKPIHTVSQNKFQSTTKTNQVPTRQPTQSSFFTLPKRPLTSKPSTKITNRPLTTKTTRRFESTSQQPPRVFVNPNTSKTTPRSNHAKTSTFTTRGFISTTPRPVNPFTNSVFTSSSGQSTSKSTKTFATTQKSSKSTIFNRNIFTTTTSPITTRTPLLNGNKLRTTKKPFASRFPGNAARSPGGSFSFSHMKINNLTIVSQHIDMMRSNPSSSSSSFGFSSSGKPLDSNLRVHPLVTNPHSMVSDQDQESQHSTQHILAAPLKALSAPSQSFDTTAPNNHLVHPSFSDISNNGTVPIANVIEPPTARRKGSSPIKLSRNLVMNPQVVRAEPRQESPYTPFTMRPSKFSPFGVSEEVVPGGLHVSFQSARGNRAFFIPSSGLTLPEETLKTPSNSLTGNLEDHDQDNNSEHHGHGTHMTMLFPGSSEHSEHGKHMTMLFPGSSETPVISALVINPKCPHCHPAFLRPGHCEPCVRIRR